MAGWKWKNCLQQKQKKEWVTEAMSQVQEQNYGSEKCKDLEGKVGWQNEETTYLITKEKWTYPKMRNEEQ